MDSIQIPKIENVTWVTGKLELCGTLYLTAHQLLLRRDSTTENESDSENQHQEIWFHYSLVHSIDKHGLFPYGNKQNCYLMHLICKNFALTKIFIENEMEYLELYKSLSKLINTVELHQLYAFYYEPQDTKTKDGWSLYSPTKEFERQGALSSSDWRMTLINEDYSFSPTYPKILLVPAKISDNVLRYAAKFRSKSRLPVLSYMHKNGNVIARSSQPLTGLNLNRSIQDETLVEAIFNTRSSLSHYDTKPHLIVDARPTANAIAQTALGAGTEINENYPRGKLIFLGIENIHAVRDSMNKVIEIRKQADLYGSPGSLSLEKTGWLKHIKTIVDGVITIIDTIHHQKRNVLVHCSDGWDRTAQLCSLAELCLDPYYRTIEGFAVLIEKEWCAFGHKFNDRCGHISKISDSSSEVPSVRAQIEAGSKNVSNFISNAAKSFFNTALSSTGAIKSDMAPKSASSSMDSIAQKTKSPKEMSPIFTQFLDCVYQIWIQNPDAFEFNESLLLVLNTHVYSCQFGNFLMNSENERSHYRDRRSYDKVGIKEFTWSLWDHVFANRREYSNPAYEPHVNAAANDDDGASFSHLTSTQVLLPDSQHLRYWSALFMNITGTTITSKPNRSEPRESDKSLSVNMLDLSELQNTLNDPQLLEEQNVWAKDSKLDNGHLNELKDSFFNDVETIEEEHSLENASFKKTGHHTRIPFTDDISEMESSLDTKEPRKIANNQNMDNKEPDQITEKKVSLDANFFDPLGAIQLTQD